MKALHILILGIFLSLPLAGNAVVHYPSVDVIHYEKEEVQKKKKEKPRKRFRKWMRNHPGTLMFGGFAVAGIAMIVLGVLWKMRWLWLTGLFTVLAPWILGFIFLLLMLIFGFGHRPPPLLPTEPVPEEETETEKKEEY